MGGANTTSVYPYGAVRSCGIPRAHLRKYGNMYMYEWQLVFVTRIHRRSRARVNDSLAVFYWSAVYAVKPYRCLCSETVAIERLPRRHSYDVTFTSAWQKTRRMHGNVRRSWRCCSFPMFIINLSPRARLAITRRLL